MTLLAMLSIAVYANALGGKFVWDDEAQIVKNESIRAIGNIPHAFATGLWSYDKTQSDANRYYRPLVTVIYALTYQLGGLSPFAYHVVNLLLHVVASLLVYLLLLELEFERFASLFAAGLFAVHPVHSEAVSWIAGLGDVACAVFYFTALLAAVRYLKRRHKAWLVIAIMSLLAALFSKEMAVTFPLVTFLVFRMTGLHLNVRQSVAAVFPYILVLGAYLITRVAAIGTTLPATFKEHATLLDWLTLAVWMFGKYIRYAVLPYPLSGLHLTPLYFHDRILSTLGYALVAVAALALTVFLTRRIARNAFLWFGVFAAMLIPVFYFKGITGGFIFAERYLYIPTLPAVALASLIVMRLPRRLAGITVVAVIAALSAGTVIRNRDWKDNESFFASSTRVYPENAYAWLGLADTSLNEGNNSLAERSYEMAQQHITDERFIVLPNSEYRLHLGLGTLAAYNNMSEAAKKHLVRALEIDPAGGDAYTILAAVLANLDRNPEAAIPLLQKAIELDPLNDQARDSMGVALFSLRRVDEAIPYFLAALQINPQNELAKQHLQIARRALEPQKQ